MTPLAARDHTEHSSVAKEFPLRGAVPRLYVMVGPPGAGKSTFSKKLQALGVAWLSRDQIRGWMGSYTPVKEAYTLETMAALAKGILLDGRSVVVDANHVRISQRAEVLQWATDLSRRHDQKVETIVLYLPVRLEDSKARRKADIEQGRITEQVIDKQHRALQPPHPNEGAAVLTIDAQGTKGEDVLRMQAMPFTTLDLRPHPSS